MSRGIEDSFPVGEEKSASGSPLAAVQKFHLAAVDVHAKNLVAFKWRPGGLKNYFGAVIRKVRLGILPAKGELLQIFEAHLVGWGLRRRGILGSDEKRAKRD